MSDDPDPLRYDQSVFEVASLDEAKRIILTAEDSSTGERWERETPYLADSIADFLEPDEKSLLVDYGCGIGRMSKALIERHGCTVLGVDISHSMRHLAPAYVGDTRFATCALPVFETLVGRGVQIDGAIAIWALQHSPVVTEDIERIRRALKPGGKLFVCNSYRAAVPTNKGWTDIGFDIQELLARAFETVSIEGMSSEHTTDLIAGHAFLGCYRKAAA